MRKLLFPIVTAVILTACGGQEVKTEVELVTLFKTTTNSFDMIFNDAEKYDKDKLAVLCDSVSMFLNEIKATYPTSAELPDLLYSAGEMNMKAQKGKEALLYLNQLVDSFPEHPMVPKAMYFIGYTLETVLEDIEGAKAAYKNLYRLHAGSDWAENARSQVSYLNNPGQIEDLKILSDSTDAEQDSL